MWSHLDDIFTKHFKYSTWYLCRMIISIINLSINQTSIAPISVAERTDSGRLFQRDGGRRLKSSCTYHLLLQNNSTSHCTQFLQIMSNWNQLNVTNEWFVLTLHWAQLKWSLSCTMCNLTQKVYIAYTHSFHPPNTVSVFNVSYTRVTVWGEARQGELPTSTCVSKSPMNDYRYCGLVYPFTRLRHAKSDATDMNNFMWFRCAFSVFMLQTCRHHHASVSLSCYAMCWKSSKMTC